MKRLNERCMLSSRITAIVKWLIIAQVFASQFDVLQQVLASSSSERTFRGNKISKCCPNGYELQRSADATINELTENLNNLPEPRYSCMITIEAVIANDSANPVAPLFGYNLQISESEVVLENDLNNIPQCSDMELFQFKVDGGLISSNGCIDYLNGVLHGLKCADGTQVEVHTLSKCCLPGWSYDLTERRCVENLDDLRFFDGFVVGGAVALLQTKTPVCRHEEDVFVEYFTDRQRVELSRSGLDVTSLLSGESEFLLPDTFCVEGIVSNASDVAPVIIRSCRPRSICQRMPCVRRCCKNDQVLERINGTSVCVDNSQNIGPIFHEITGPIEVNKLQNVVVPLEYGLLHTQKCVKFRLLNDDPADMHFISHIDGSLHMLNDGPFDNDHYCVENLKMGDEIEYFAFVCFQPFPQTRFKYYATGLALSSIFLWMTLIVYASLPKLLNLHGKTLVCHVSSLLLSYTALSVMQFHTDTQIEKCYILGYLIYFGFLSAFCWQSIMCFDIWWTFGSVRASRGMRKTKELRRFLLYSLYAWGVPSVLTTCTVLIDHYDLVPLEWSPQMVHNNSCWFKKDAWRARFVYFLLPIGIHIITNSVLFTLTSHHCSKVKNDIHRMQVSGDDPQMAKKRFLADKTKYVMNIKLFIVMGVSWTLEIFATILQKPEILWYVTDAFNILQGVLVFLIFVFKWKVWTAIQQRLGIQKATTKGTTNATATTYVTGATSKDGVNMHRYGKMGKSASNSTLASSNVNLTQVQKP